jgi:hypothetical protein
MPTVFAETLTVAGDQVRIGDVINVGGIPHRIRDMREVYPRRRRLEFDDGNAYVLAVTRTIEVTRTYVAEPLRAFRGHRVRPVRPVLPDRRMVAGKSVPLRDTQGERKDRA